MTVLILGFPRDVHIHAVRWALDQVGVGHHVLYTPDMPHLLRASVRVSAGTPATASFRSGSVEGATGGYDTVWYRRSGEAIRPPGMPDADWIVASRESDHHIRTLRRSLAPSAYWVNGLEAREQAQLKMPQLIAASACGLSIPETLFSNDPDEIRRFWAQHRQQGVIFKLNVQTYWGAPDAASHVLFTTELRDAHLAEDDALSSCPAIYQRKVEKDYELRVTCMDERCFTARLDSQSRDITRTDWRADLRTPLKPTLHELPPKIEERCIAVMRKLGLVFGCIDMIVTPHGEHVFLEVNEMGQFLWVEKGEPGCPMLRAFASLLIQHRLDRSSQLVGSDRISFQAFLETTDWARACAEDEVHHAHYSALRTVSDP
jgi:glutathione synthase/RimK-type ligase-like ATP-grasp enzyme